MRELGKEFTDEKIFVFNPKVNATNGRCGSHCAIGQRWAQLKKAVEENNTRQLTLMNAKLNEFVLHACYDKEAM